LHGEGALFVLSGFTACPGLFYATPARDGILSRIRIPGGIINSQQCRVLADLSEQCGNGYVDVTNRANLQVRQISSEIDDKILRRLQEIGLGSSNTDVDHIRNIMSSPTAGIDPQELLDTCPFVQAWDQYIATHPHLSGLPAKFSVGFDGGGSVRVCDRPNDIGFAAMIVDGSLYLCLHLSVGEKGEPPRNMGILLKPEECLPALIAMADVYLNCLDITSRGQPRLREVLNTIGYQKFLQAVEQRLPFSLRYVDSQACQTQNTPNYLHIGVHPQRQSGLSYIGVVLPLGRLETSQLRGLADIAEWYGSGTIRLTPWQNLLVSDIPNQQVSNVQDEIERLGLHWSVANIRSALVACSGNTGCASSATDTKGHALALAKYLDHLKLTQPLNIHFSGCQKSCAQHTKSDIALIGISTEQNMTTVESYHVYIGDTDSEQKFGREIYQAVTFPELPPLIEKMLTVYQNQQLTPQESFKAFSTRHTTPQLKQLFSPNQQ
jgi:ferredoxin-nitrite reductase